jgi:hypothetical protein
VKKTGTYIQGGRPKSRENDNAMNRTLIQLRDGTPQRYTSNMKTVIKVKDYQDTLDNRLSRPKREATKFVGGTD